LSYNALKSSGTSPNFLITLASLDHPFGITRAVECDRPNMTFLAR
jgi:hypothetical protein